MTVGSMFSGIGGFDEGFERAGMEVIWHAEIDDAASRVLAHHWPEVPNLGDVGSRSFQPHGHRRGGGDARHHGRQGAVGAERVDLLCGGFPCQDLSVAGKRAGLAGERSGLFFAFARAAELLRPRWVVVENVPGLLSSNGGADFRVVIDTLADVGYPNVAWRVLDSLQFGVPQRRRRVFIVGCADERADLAALLLEPEGRPWRPPTRGEAGPGAAGAAAASTLQGGGRRGHRVDAEGAAGGHLVPVAANALTASAGHHGHSSPRGDGSDNLIPTAVGALRSRDAKGTAEDVDHPAFIPVPFRKTYNAPGTEGDRWANGDYANTLNCFDNGETRARDLAVTPVGFHETGQGWWNESQHAGALRAEGENRPSRPSHAVYDGMAVRRLTPVECERLQGFPDGWTESAGSDSARYRCLGNAVTVNVAEWLGHRIVAEEARLNRRGAA